VFEVFTPLVVTTNSRAPYRPGVMASAAVAAMAEETPGT
jgi:hypothetical protein